MNLRVIVAYAAMCAIWGTTWYAIKLALIGFPPITGAGLRFVVAGAIFAVVAAFIRRPGGIAPPRRLIVTLAITFFGLNYVLVYFAEQHLASGLVSVLFGTTPFFIFALAATMLGESLHARVVAGALIALAGVAVISLTGERADLPAIGAALLSSFLAAYGNVELKRYAASDPLRTLPPAMLLAGTTMTIVGFIGERTDMHAALAPAPILATLYLAVAGSAVAFYFNHWLLQRLSAAIVGLSALIIPVIAVAFGAVVAHEAFGPRDAAGALLVIVGMALALAPPPQRRSTPLVTPSGGSRSEP